MRVWTIALNASDVTYSSNASADPAGRGFTSIFCLYNTARSAFTTIKEIASYDEEDEGQNEGNWDAAIHRVKTSLLLRRPYERYKDNYMKIFGKFTAANT